MLGAWRTSLCWDNVVGSSWRGGVGDEKIGSRGNEEFFVLRSQGFGTRGKSI